MTFENNEHIHKTKFAIFNYRIRPNYRTLCLSFSQLLGKLVVKYEWVHLKRAAKD